jgi:HSP20 family protein
MPQAKQAKENTHLERQRPEDRGLARRDDFTSWTPFSFMRRFGEEMERMFDDFGLGAVRPFTGLGAFGRTGFDWVPETEIFERDNQLVIRADLPGLTKDDVNVEIEEDHIVIRGERRSEHKEEEKGFYRTERSYGSFYRSLPLPQGVDTNKAAASFNNGVLEVTMPAPAKKIAGKRLEITEGMQGGKKGKVAGA